MVRLFLSFFVDLRVHLFIISCYLPCTDLQSTGRDVEADIDSLWRQSLDTLLHNKVAHSTNCHLGRLSPI